MCKFINYTIVFNILIFVLLMTNCENNMEPIAKKIKKQLTLHGDTRIDNYYWLNQRENKEVIDYLNEENVYTEKMFQQPTKTFQESLFKEIKDRIKKDVSSVPYKYNGYYYSYKYEKGKEYRIHIRKKGSLKAKEEVIFDENLMQDGYSYYRMGTYKISMNNKLTAFSEDTLSRRIYTIKFKDLTTGKLLPDEIENTTGYMVWANDNKTIFYVRKDAKTLRAFQIYKHILGSPVDQDELVYQEDDETFYCSVDKSKSNAYLIIHSGSTLSDEYRVLDASKPNGKWKIIQKREKGLEYSISNYKGYFYILTNWHAKNFRLMKTPVNRTQKQYWKEVISHRKNVLIEGIDIFKNYLVVEERDRGLNKIRVIRWDGKADYTIPVSEQVYSMGTSVNLDFDTDILRYKYNSMTTPKSIFDFNMKDKSQKLLQQQEVLGDFNPNNYQSERIFATAEDGTQIPISLVYQKGIKKTKNTPLLLYGYGSYGYTISPNFSSMRLSLLNRGFIYAIAHIRGGQYMGRDWYENGKMLNKKNTFADYIASAKHLIQENYTSSKHLYAMGGSAGGLLMGAVINMAPELFNGVIAAVPFVDVVTTMLDESIPLTTFEYDEWGNPNQKEYYEYIKSYSPYDNVEINSYPNILVTTGLHDSQVQYWEPAKWVAKLRQYRTNDNLLLLHTNMETGHGGSSGRFESLKELAMKYAFFLHLEGINK